VHKAEQTKTTTGEEEEDTKYSLRSKLYSMEPDGGWKERGVGVLKVNVRKGDGKGARLGMFYLASLRWLVKGRSGVTKSFGEEI
jgi:Ran-binding protein 3